MLTGNQWWLFKFSERLNILLEETTGDDVLHVSVAAQNLYKLFHDQQENFLVLVSGKGEERRNSE